MTFINGFTLLLIFQMTGEIISSSLSLTIPGAVIGMLLLFFSLFFIPQKDTIHTSAQLLLRHLSLLFIPAGVGLILHIERLSANWVPVGIAIIAGVTITMLSTALIMQTITYLTMQTQKSKKQSKGESNA